MDDPHNAVERDHGAVRDARIAAQPGATAQAGRQLGMVDLLGHGWVDFGTSHFALHRIRMPQPQSTTHPRMRLLPRRKKRYQTAWHNVGDPAERRRLLIEAAQELAPRIGAAAACAALGVPRSSFYQARTPPRPRAVPRPRPRAHRALSPEEEQTIRGLLNAERFVDQAPRTIYATLLDEGLHHCSWRTMYRLLAQDQATRERRAQRRRPLYLAPELLATAPRQVWSWDITKLRGPRAGIWYSLYVVLDIFSRKLVGWLIETREDAALAEALIAESYRREGIAPNQLTLHADRGAPMTSKTVAELLIDLGVAQSHSRPTISDDNPYSESQFKTMKYGPSYPERFASLEAARAWIGNSPNGTTTRTSTAGCACCRRRSCIAGGQMRCWPRAKTCLMPPMPRIPSASRRAGQWSAHCQRR